MLYGLFIVVILLLFLWMVYLLLIMPAKVDKSKYKWFTSYKYAHRGLFTHDQTIPENSLPAFKRAVENGYGIELDVRISTDDQIYVFHDDTLTRMTGVDKKTETLSYPELLEYKLGNSDAKIPLFSEVLEIVNGKTPLIVELKKSKRYPELCQKTYDLLKNYKGNYCIESFDPRIVKWFKDNAPEILRGQLSMRYKKFKSFGDFIYKKIILENLLSNCSAKPHFIAYRWKDMDKLSLRLCKKLGAFMACWTVKDKEGWEKTEPFFDGIIFESDKD